MSFPFPLREGQGWGLFLPHTFLTPARLRSLASDLNLVWQVHTPGLDWRSAVGRTVGGLRARREPARFPVIVGRPSQ